MQWTPATQVPLWQHYLALLREEALNAFNPTHYYILRVVKAIYDVNAKEGDCKMSLDDFLLTFKTEMKKAEEEDRELTPEEEKEARAKASAWAKAMWCAAVGYTGPL